MNENRYIMIVLLKANLHNIFYRILEQIKNKRGMIAILILSNMYFFAHLNAILYSTGIFEYRLFLYSHVFIK